MSTVHWQRVTELFAQASALPRDMQIEFLRKSCPNDSELQREILSLLEHDETAPPDFLQTADGQPFGTVSGTSPADPYVGILIGKYQINRVIAAGGMGTVYEAEQKSPKRLVAIKLMHAGAWSNSARRRFEFECQALGRLTHPNIAQIYEAGQWNPQGASQDLPYFAMEYVPEARLITDYARDHDLSTHNRLELFLQVCDAVNYGHQRSLIHRDLKPANMLVDATGKVKVIDFGVARATDADMTATTMRTDVGELIGTLFYMSPEQCEGDPLAIDVRSDVYSLGVVLFQLLTGQLPYPFRGTSIYHTTRTIRENSPTRPSSVVPALRGDLETIVLKALEKDPQRRYQSVADFADDLQHYRRHEPIVARRPSAMHQLQLFARRNRGLAVTIAVLALVLIVTTIVSSALAISERRAQAKSKDREYAMNLAVAAASIQRYDVADAMKRLDDAADMPLSNKGKGWELGHLRSLLDQSIARVPVWSEPIRQMSMNPSATVIALVNHLNGRVQVRRIEYVDGVPKIGAETNNSVSSADVDGSVESIAVGADGKWIAVGTNQGSIYLVDLLQPGEPAIFLTIPTSLRSVDRLAVNAVGKRLAASDNGDGHLEVWDITNMNRPQRVLDRKDLSVLSMSFSNSGRYLALGGDDHVVRLLDLETGSTPALVAELRGHSYKVTGVSFRPDEEVLASSSLDGTVRLWGIFESINERSTLAERAKGISRGILQTGGQGIMTVAFSTDGTVVATGGLDNTTRLWDVDDHRIVRSQLDHRQTGELPAQREYAILRGHEEQVSGLAFAPSGDWLVTAGWDGSLRIFAIGEQREVPTLVGHKSSVWGAVFDPSGNWLISGGGESATFVWDVDAAEAVKASYAHDSAILGLSLSDDGALLASIDETGIVRVSTLDGDSQTLEEITRVSVGQHWAQGIAWSNKHRRLAAGSRNGDVCVWSFEDPRHPSVQFKVRCTDGPVPALAFLDPSGNFLAVGSGSEIVDGSKIMGSLAIWNTETGVKLKELPGFAAGVRALAVSPDGTRLAVGTTDGTVESWDIRDPQAPKQTWTGESHTAPVCAVAFHPDATRIASGSRDRSARIWDVSTGEELLTLRDHPGGVLSVTFSPDGLTLATCSSGQWGSDNSIKLWEAHTQSLERDKRRWLRSQAALARRTAKPLVDDRFAEMICKDSVLDALRGTASMAPEVKKAAARLAESRIGPLGSWPQILDSSLLTSSPKDDVERTLKVTECLLAEIPKTHVNAGFLGLAKGMALYRLGRFDEASAALGDSAAVFQQRIDDSRFPDAAEYLIAAKAARAMSLFQSGSRDEARKLFEEAQTLQALSLEVSLQDTVAVLKEAGSLIDK